MSAPPLPPAVLRLVAYLLDGADPDDALTDLPGWLVASPRFRAFAEANRDKIRKKVRGARTPGARLDLRAELQVAALLLADRRIELVFEAYGVGSRGPDFTATHRAGRPFNVEVTRRHLDHPDAAIAAPILDKLRQLPPSRSNVLVVALDGIPVAPDPGPTVRDLRARADRGDDAPFMARGLEGAAAFHVGLRRLAAVVAWVGGAAPGEGARVWTNGGARIPLPEATLRALIGALSGRGPSSTA